MSPRILIIVLLLSLTAILPAYADTNSDLIEAAWSGQVDVVQALLNRGAKVNIRNKNDGTALMFAAKQDRVEIVKAWPMALRST